MALSIVTNLIMMLASAIKMLAAVINIAFRGGAVMFILQRFALDRTGLNRTSANTVIQLGVLTTMVVYSAVSYFVPGYSDPGTIGPQTAILMTGYQLFNFYEDVTGIPVQLAQRRCRHQDNAVRRNAAIERYIHRTIVMLFHHAVAFIISAALVLNKVDADVWTIYLYFGGLSEISTIWYTMSTYIKDNRHSVEYSLGVVNTSRAIHWLLALFAATFLTVRVIGWTLVIIQNWTLLNSQGTEIKWLFYCLTALQYYWGVKIVSMLRRELRI